MLLPTGSPVGNGLRLKVRRGKGKKMSKLWENTLTGEVLDDFGNVIEVCCDNPVIPKGIQTGYARLSGAYVATCDNCDYVCAYWDCPCELAHDCEAN